MRQLFPPLPRVKTLSVMPTYKCNAACKHCGTCSSPFDKTFLDPELMFKGIREAIECDYKVIVFTGGEATLVEDTLIAGIRLASTAGICTRLVTNAWWAADENAADAMIEKLVSAGLIEINFSTGDQHVRFVPLDNVLRACHAAAKIPMRTNLIMVEVVADRVVTKRTILDHPLYKRITADFPRAGVRIRESPWMPLSPATTSAYPDGLAITRSNLPNHTGCTSCLGTTTLQADGRIAACCGIGMRIIPELHVGRISEMSIAQADKVMEDDFLKRWIRVEGPEKILAWAGTHDPEIHWEGMYAHHCQACVRLYKDPKVRQVIFDHHQEKIADVLQAEWLLYQYQNEQDSSTDLNSTGVIADSTYGEGLSSP